MYALDHFKMEPSLGVWWAFINPGVRLYAFKKKVALPVYVFPLKLVYPTCNMHLVSVQHFIQRVGALEAEVSPL